MLVYNSPKYRHWSDFVSRIKCLIIDAIKWSTKMDKRLICSGIDKNTFNELCPTSLLSQPIIPLALFPPSFKILS